MNRFPGHQKEFRAALLFLLPNITGFLLFTAGPVLASLLLSFTSWDLLSPPKWVGMTNFIDLLGFHHTVEGWVSNDPFFWQYLGNTFFLLMSLPVNMMGSLCLAIILNKKLRFTYAYRLVFFLPSILSGVAIFYLWKWMYNPDFGIINKFLSQIGIHGPNWLTDYYWAKPAIMIMGFWMGVGGTSMILYLAALQAVPLELYEAAEIDGANAWNKFKIVTWPSVAPVTFFILTMGLIHGMQGGFEMAYIMTGGGPSGSTTTIGFYIYRTAYVSFEMGYASTIAWVLFMIVLSITIFNWKQGKQNITV